MAPDADATAGPPQGWHDLEAVLAEEPVARLLAAYIAMVRVRGRSCEPVSPAAHGDDRVTVAAQRMHLVAQGWSSLSAGPRAEGIEGNDLAPRATEGVENAGLAGGEGDAVEGVSVTQGGKAPRTMRATPARFSAVEQSEQ